MVVQYSTVQYKSGSSPTTARRDVCFFLFSRPPSSLGTALFYLPLQFPAIIILWFFQHTIIPMVQINHIIPQVANDRSLLLAVRFPACQLSIFFYQFIINNSLFSISQRLYSISRYQLCFLVNLRATRALDRVR